MDPTQHGIGFLNQEDRDLQLNVLLLCKDLLTVKLLQNWNAIFDRYCRILAYLLMNY